MICRQLLLCPLYHCCQIFKIILMFPCVNASTNYSTRLSNYPLPIVAGLTWLFILIAIYLSYVCFKIARLAMDVHKNYMYIYSYELCKLCSIEALSIKCQCRDRIATTYIPIVSNVSRSDKQVFQSFINTIEYQYLYH